MGWCSATRVTNIMSFGQLTQKIDLKSAYVCQVCPCFTLALRPQWFLAMVLVVMHTGIELRAKEAGICTRALAVTGQSTWQG